MLTLNLNDTCSFSCVRIIQICTHNLWRAYRTFCMANSQHLFPSSSLLFRFFPTNATTHWRITHYAPYSHFALCYCAHKFTLLLFYYLYKYNLVWLCAITSSLFFLFLSLCVCGVFFFSYLVYLTKTYIGK